MFWRPGLSAAAREHSHALAHSLRHQPCLDTRRTSPEAPDAGCRGRLVPQATAAAGDGWRGRRLPRVPGAAEGLPAARGAGMPGARHAARLPSGGASNKSWGPRTWHDLFQAPRWCARSRSEVARGVCESGRVPDAGPVGLSGARCQLGGRGPVPSGGLSDAGPVGLPGANSVVGGRCPVEGSDAGLWVCPLPTRWSGAGAQWRCPVPTLRVCPVPGANSGAGARCRGPVPSGRVPGPSGECPVPASPVPGGRSGLRRECVYGSGAGPACAAECRPGASAAWDGLGADSRRGIQTRTASGLMSKRRPRHTG